MASIIITEAMLKGKIKNMGLDKHVTLDVRCNQEKSWTLDYNFYFQGDNREVQAVTVHTVASACSLLAVYKIGMERGRV